MSRTKNVKVEFGVKIETYPRVNQRKTTKGCAIRNMETVRILQHEGASRVSSGYRRVDIAEQRRKAVYSKVNKMLGGI